MRTSFHHQPEAQHPIFQLSTSWQADYPIFRSEADMGHRRASTCWVANDPSRSSAAKNGATQTDHCVAFRGSQIPVLMG